VLLYSSFFTNFPQGVLDSVRTFGYWFKTSKSDHSYGVTKYLEWLWQQEAPVLILGAVGIVIALWRAAQPICGIHGVLVARHSCRLQPGELQDALVRAQHPSSRHYHGRLWTGAALSTSSGARLEGTGSARPRRDCSGRDRSRRGALPSHRPQ